MLATYYLRIEIFPYFTIDPQLNLSDVPLPIMDNAPGLTKAVEPIAPPAITTKRRGQRDSAAKVELPPPVINAGEIGECLCCNFSHIFPIVIYRVVLRYFYIVV